MKSLLTDNWTQTSYLRFSKKTGIRHFHTTIVENVRYEVQSGNFFAN